MAWGAEAMVCRMVCWNLEMDMQWVGFCICVCVECEKKEGDIAEEGVLCHFGSPIPASGSIPRLVLRAWSEWVAEDGREE